MTLCGTTKNAKSAKARSATPTALSASSRTGAGKVRLGDVCVINMGQSPDSSSYNGVSKGLPFYQGNADFGERYPTPRTWCNAPKKIASMGEILISVRAPIGALNFANEDCCIGRGLASIKAGSSCHPGYAYYALRSLNAELNKRGTGSTFKAINKKELALVEFPLPHLPTQQRIADELDQLCALKKNAEDRLAILDQIVKSRFVEMFGDTFANPMKWETRTFREASLRLSDGPFGSNLKSSHYSESGVRVVRLGNIGVGEFLNEDQSYIPIEHYEKLKKYTCRKGELVFGTLGEPNLRACLIPEYIEFAVNKSDCVHYIPRPELLDNQFVCSYVNSAGTLRLASSMVHGQTRTRVSSGQIAELPIFVPPLALQREFAAFVAEVDKSKLTLRETVATLDRLYRAKLQEYFG